MTGILAQIDAEIARLEHRVDALRMARAFLVEDGGAAPAAEATPASIAPTVSGGA